MIYSAKNFKEYIAESAADFIEDCKRKNNRNYVTREDLRLMRAYFPKVDDLKNYGYYHYNEHTKEYRWTKNKY